MNILLTNDDGINAEGIEVLAKALIKEDHKVTIAAPNVENSGKSHAITFKSPLMVQEKKLEGLEDVKSLCVYGTPADCVRAAVHLLDEKFDFCFSGINSGLTQRQMYSTQAQFLQQLKPTYLTYLPLQFHRNG